MIASHRGTDPKSLHRQIRGDLDWIVMKCLEKDRTRRYDTANALLMELHRFLNNEPVLAGPPSAAYRFRKFVRRNRGSVLASAITAFVLVLGIVGTTWGMFMALKEKSRANSISTFLQNMLATANPYESGDKDMTVVELLDQASIRASTELASEPAVEAAVRRTIGTTYHDLGLRDKGKPELRRAVELGSQYYGEDHPFVADTLQTLYWLLEKTANYPEAEEACRRALGIRRRLFGEEHPSVACSLDALGNLYRVKGDLPGAEKLLREAMELYQRMSLEPTGDCLNNLALVLQYKGEFSEAEMLFRRAIKKDQQELGENHPKPFRYSANLGLMLLWDSRFSEAEVMLNRTSEVWTKALGPTHPFTLEALHHQAEALTRLGRGKDAMQPAEDAVDGYRKTITGDHAEFAHALNILGTAQLAEGRLSEAEATLREALDMRMRLPDSWRKAETKSLLGAALASQGKFEESETLLREGYERISKGAFARYAEREAIERIVAAYGQWDFGEPGKGYDLKAGEWRRKLDVLGQPEQGK